MDNFEHRRLREYDNAIRRFRLNAFGLLFFRYFLGYFTIFCFLLGTVVLILRITTQLERFVLLFPVVGMVTVTLAAFLRAGKGVPSRSVLKASLDNQSVCGGLFMASDETDIGDWQGQMPRESLPKLKWKGQNSRLLALSAVVFVIIAFFMPQKYVEISRAGRLDISNEIEQITEQLEVLTEEEIVTQIEAKEIDEELEKILQEASGAEPAKTWESMDHLQDKLSQKAQESAQKSLSMTEKATEAQVLAEAMLQGANLLDEATMTEAMAEMAAMMKAAMSQNEAFKNALDQETLEMLKKALKKGQFSKAELGELCEGLKLSKGQLRECLGNLCKANLIDARMLKLCDSLGECDGGKLAAFLAKQGNCFGLGEAIGMCRGIPGRGGISRGRGDATLTWRQPSSEEGLKFKEQILPEASMSGLKDSKLVGVSLGSPSEEVPTGNATSGSLQSAAAGSGSAHTQVILPQHKGAVKRYFTRDK